MKWFYNRDMDIEEKKIMDTLDETKCKNILINTKELYQWIKKKLLKKLEDTQQ